MRPVNLIPPEERRDASVKLRSGPLAYLLIGALAALLIGITLVVTTSNEISSSKAEASRLQRENTEAETRAAQLTAYTSFRAVHDQRVATITQLANSRFDWERVVKELSLILPSDVWLTNLTGTANPSVSVNGSATVGLRASVPGPALEILGCASGQEAVAGFVSDLKDIDGVTRVAVESSVLGSAEESAATGEGGEGSSVTSCQTRNFIAQFQIVAAFDAAPAPALGGEG